MTTQPLVEVLINRRVSNLGLDPFPWYKQMRMTNPVTIDEQNKIGEVFRYRDVQYVLSDPQLFSSERFASGQGNRQRFRPSIAGMDPPRHKRLRHLFAQAFASCIAGLEAKHVRDVVNELLDAATASGTLEVIKDLAVPLPVRMTAELLGVPDELQADFKHWSSAIVSGSLEQAYAGFDGLEEIIRTLIVQRRKERQSDLISTLLAAEGVGGRATEEEIVEFCAAMLMVGHETTTTVIGNMMLCLDDYPAAREQIWSDPSLLPSAIEEVLRFRSVLQRGSRRVTRDTEIGGKQLKEGYTVFYWTGSANRDEEYFSDPDVFDIRRSPNPHLGFGYGIHFCFGAPLSRLETRVAMEQIIERFKDFQRVREVPLQMVTSVGTYGVQQLPVRLEKR